MNEGSSRKRLRLAFAFGGKAAEHDLAVKSAIYLLAHVDRSRFEVTTIYVDEAGVLAGRGAAAAKLASFLEGTTASIFGAHDSVPPDLIPWLLSTLPADRPGESLRLLADREVDAVFPVFHGQGGEDGLFQGFLETLRLPYVGCGVTGSILGNDKTVNKAICRNAGIPVADFLSFDRHDWAASAGAIVEEAESRLGYPAFVKPPCLGSSVGIEKAIDRATLRHAVETAFTYGNHAIIERGLVGMEYGIGLIGNDEPEQSAIVEFGGCPGFLDYEAKYGPDAFEDRIPAIIDRRLEDEMRGIATRVWRLLGLRGMSRLDFFEVDGKAVFNEANTVPGFGRTSVFSKMWEASGVRLPELVSRLAGFAIEAGQAGADQRAAARAGG